MADFDLRNLRDGGNLDDEDLVYVQRPQVGEAAGGPLRIYGQKIGRVEKDEFNNTVTVEDGYWEDLRFPSQGINPAGSPAPATIDNTASGMPGTLLFASNADNHVAGVAQLPHSWQRGTAIRPHVHWAKTTSATGTVAWRLRYTWADIGEEFGAYSSWASGTSGVANSDTANKHALYNFGEMVPATGVGESSMIIWELMRDVSEDDYAANARLLELDFHYQTNKSGTKSEIPS